MKPRLFVDLDGVLADFDAGFPRIFGVDHKSITDEEMHRHIKARPGFFADLHPFDGAKEFFQSIMPLNPMILTAAPKEDYENAARNKHAWIRKHIDADVLVLPVLGGRNKPCFMQSPGDVLIDDFIRNCDLWFGAGGIAIRHKNYSDTLEQLESVYGEKNLWEKCGYQIKGVHFAPRIMSKAYDEECKSIVRMLGVDAALITDESSVRDFLSHVFDDSTDQQLFDENLRAVSDATGMEATMDTRVWKLAQALHLRMCHADQTRK